MNEIEVKILSIDKAAILARLASLAWPRVKKRASGEHHL